MTDLEAVGVPSGRAGRPATLSASAVTKGYQFVCGPSQCLYGTVTVRPRKVWWTGLLLMNVNRVCVI